MYPSPLRPFRVNGWEARFLIRIKRFYDNPEESDGERYRVDRIWPRGISKKRAQLAGWLRKIAPSEDLRKWFGHDPERWSEFKRRCKLELRAKEKRDAIASLSETAGNGTVTLLYAARDRRHNNAAVLAEVLEKFCQTRSDSVEKHGNRLIQDGIQIRQKIPANTYPTLLLDPGYYTNDEDIAAGSFVNLALPDENAGTGGWFRPRFAFGAVFHIDADGPIRYKEVIA